MQGHLAMVDSIFSTADCIETVRMKVTVHAVRALIEKGESSKLLVKQFLTGIYMFTPRPDQDDIIDVKAEPVSTETGDWILTVKVKRGQFGIVEFLLRHGDCGTHVTRAVTGPDSLLLVCAECHTELHVPLSSIPRAPGAWRIPFVCNYGLQQQ